MPHYSIALLMIILLTGIIISMLLTMGEQMDKFNSAIARVQESANKSNAKIDLLLAGQQGAVDAAVDAALSNAADQVNAIADTLDTKNG